MFCGLRDKQSQWLLLLGIIICNRCPLQWETAMRLTEISFSELCPWLFLLVCANRNLETGNRHQIFLFLVLNFIQKSIPPATHTPPLQKESAITLMIAITAVIKHHLCWLTCSTHQDFCEINIQSRQLRYNVHYFWCWSRCSVLYHKTYEVRCISMMFIFHTI